MRARVKLPRFAPVVPKKAGVPFDDPHYTFEPKWDGFRGLYYQNEGRAGWRAKSGGELWRFTELMQALARELTATSIILDGEVIAPDATGHSDFLSLIRGEGKPLYIVFDILWLNGKDLRGLQLRERRGKIPSVLAACSHVIHTRYCDKQGMEYFRALCKEDFEGMVAKRLDAPYDAQTAHWYKILNPAYSQIKPKREYFKRIQKRKEKKAAR